MGADFGRAVVEAIAKRSGNICSNPDCGALTSGPAEDEARAINVGEAAHIYGARPEAARYSETMGDADRAAISNGIWLCRNCHKMVDADELGFPADLLFEWRRQHERVVLESLGKAGALMRQKVLEKRLEGFEGCSYLAQQIIIDRPAAWEYLLTAELLRSKLEPIKFRYEALEKGLYSKQYQSMGVEEYIPWQELRFSTLGDQIGALSKLVSEELYSSWGPPGKPGSEIEILRACSLIVEACQRLLDWEEQVRFVRAPDEFEEFHSLLRGIAGPYISKIFEIPTWMGALLSQEDVTGTHEFTVVFDLPEGWRESCEKALQKAGQRLKRRWS